MTPITRQILDAALSLPESERSELVDELICSLDSTVDAPLHPAWRAEIERRIADVASGKSKLIPGDEALRMIREKRKCDPSDETR
jgi:putative addiction module component (TIGR02574 family)